MSDKKSGVSIGFIIVMGGISLFALVSVASVMTLYFSEFNGTWGDQEIFAQFGDFLGGVLNPIFSFLTVILLVWSLYMQRKELGQVVEEMELTRDVHQSSVNMKHYLYLIEECLKPTSDINGAAGSFRDYMDGNTMTLDLSTNRYHQYEEFTLFSVLSNEALFNHVKQDGYIVNMKNLNGEVRTVQRTLSDYTEGLNLTIDTISQAVELIKALGCPRWRAREVTEIMEDLITDYYEHERCSPTYKTNLIEVLPKFSTLIGLNNSYIDDVQKSGTNS